MPLDTNVPVYPVAFEPMIDAKKKRRRPKTRKKPGEMRQVFAANVRELMELRYERYGDKVKVLAKASGVSRSTVQRIVNAEFATNVDTVDSIADALGVPAFQLLVRRAK